MVEVLDKARVEAAIAAAEKETSAEVVLAVTDVSESYGVYPLLWSALAGFLAVGAQSLILPDSHLRFAFAAAGGLALVVWLALAFTPLGLVLVPAEVKTRAARGLAHLEFAERVAGRTAKANGILIFVALKEHHIEIVPDAGLRAKLGDGAWDAVIAAMVAALREGRVTDGIVAGIAACARIAAPVFPYDPDDRNEIDDAVVEVKP